MKLDVIVYFENGNRSEHTVYGIETADGRLKQYIDEHDKTVYVATPLENIKHISVTVREEN